MAYPLENVEIVSLCSRVRGGKSKYPPEYYELRKDYHATKDRDGLRYSYVYKTVENEDDQYVKVIETVGRRDIAYVIENNFDHSRYVIHFGTRYPSTEEVRINNNLAMKGIRPFIYEIGMVVDEAFYGPNVNNRANFMTKKNYQTKNEMGKPVWYWITDFYTFDYLLDTLCKNGSNIEAVYGMFATMLPIIHKDNYVITKFEMKQMFYGSCSNYKDDSFRTLMCVCPFRRWFSYPDEKVVRGEEFLPVPENRHKIDYIMNNIVRTDFSRYNSVRTDESNLVEPIDNWMSVMFIMLDVMDTYIPDCIIYDNDYRKSRFIKPKFKITDDVRDMSFNDALKLFDESYMGTKEMYKYMRNKYLYINRVSTLTDDDTVFLRNMEHRITLIKTWKKNFVQYINWMLLKYKSDISVDDIKNNLDTIVFALGGDKVFDVDGVQWTFFNLFVTCIGYISMIRQFKRNYIDSEFMTRTIPEFLHFLTIIYTCWITYNDESYKQLLHQLNPSVDIPYASLQKYMDFCINNDIQYIPVVFNIDSVGERASYQRLVDYTCMNNYTYPNVKMSDRLAEIMNNVTGQSIPDYSYEEENDNVYLRRMNSLTANLIENRNLNADPRYYNGKRFIETANRNMNKYRFIDM